MNQKKKLLVLVGAGASIHLGIPGVNAVGKLLQDACLAHYPLAIDPKRSIYDWLVEQIDHYRSSILKPAFVQQPNFEDVLYAVIQLGALYPNGFYTSSVGALVGMRHFPDIVMSGKVRQLGLHEWAELSSFLADTIIGTFREACRALEPEKTSQIDQLREFFQALASEFDVAVVTLNYDDAIWRVLPNLETGFDPTTGIFDERRLFERGGLGCFLHLHGSVHFDMAGNATAMHDIVWVRDLDSPFSQNAIGRSGVFTTEGTVFPQSVIVAGFGKTQQILRRPFRSYYSELDRLVSGSDALLCLGYGFGDLHLNGALESYRDSRNRPAVLIDWAEDNAMTAAHADWDDGRSTATALRTLSNDASRMSALGRTAPTTVKELNRAREFDLSTETARPLAVWYGGMEEVCRSPQAALAHLK